MAYEWRGGTGRKEESADLYTIDKTHSIGYVLVSVVYGVLFHP